MRLGLFAYFGGEIVRFHLPYGDGAYLLVGEFRMFHAGLLLHQQCEPLACLVKIVDDGCGAIADDRLERLAPNCTTYVLRPPRSRSPSRTPWEARCSRP